MKALALAFLGIAIGLMVGVPGYQLSKTKNHYVRNILFIIIGTILFIIYVMLIKNL